MAQKPRKTSKSTRSGFDDGVTLLTVSDVAALDNVSEKTVRRAIKAGELNAIRVGVGRRLLRIRPDDHAAYRRA